MPQQKIQAQSFQMIKTKKMNEQDKDAFLLHLKSLSENADYKTNKDEDVIVIKGKQMIRGHQSTQSSPFVGTGAQDPRGFTIDSREWLKQVQTHENADEEFFSSSITKRASKMWNDESIDDSGFAADMPIKDHRQIAAQRPTKVMINQKT
jgi:hypothetical protein